MHFFEQSHSPTVLAQSVFCLGDCIRHNLGPIESICSICWGQINVCALLVWDNGRLRLVCVLSSMFWDGLQVFSFVAETVGSKFSTQFLRALEWGTCACLALLIRHLIIRQVTYYHRAVNFLTVSLKNARWRAERTFMFLLNGVQCWRL